MPSIHGQLFARFAREGTTARRAPQVLSSGAQQVHLARGKELESDHVAESARRDTSAYLGNIREVFQGSNLSVYVRVCTRPVVMHP